MAEAGGGGKDTRNSSTVVSNPNKDNNNDPETMTSSRNVEVKIGVPDLGLTSMSLSSIHINILRRLAWKKMVFKLQQVFV